MKTNGRFPDFLIIGGMRCGSTTLYNILNNHPQIYFPKVKELHFFDRRNPDLGDNNELYKASFSGCKEDSLCGEATPDYLTTPHCDERIFDLLGSPKLVVILREPVSRLCSHYRMSVANNAENLKFEDAINSESNRLTERSDLSDIFQSYNERSDYLRHLKRFEKKFGRQSLHILFLEELNSKPLQTLKDLLKFLDLKPEVTAEMLAATKVTNRSSDIQKLRLTKLQRLFSLLKRNHSKQDPQYQITDLQKTELTKQFEEKNNLLKEWLGRDLPW